jgi:ribonuclease BN (tRNA processing enzyme)
VKLQILGCGDAFGSGGRNHSGYLLEIERRLLLLDCGPTTLLAMKKAGLDPSHLDAVFLSHLHGDHMGGLPFLFLEYLHESPRQSPLHVAGPPGMPERVRRLFQLMYGDGSRPRELPPTAFHILEPEVMTTVAGVEIFPFRVPHQVRDISLGMKLTVQGKKILYSGDSAWTDLFITHSQNVDLFLCECSFFDRDSPNHISYRKIEENLSRLGCKKLLLTHMGEEMLAQREGLPVLSAEDGLVIEI